MKIKRLFLSLTVLCATILSTWAAPVKTEQVTAELIASESHFVPGSTTSVALKLDMIPHWHVYWTNPGDSGLPPEVNWDLPEGFEVGPLQFPAPEYIPTPPLATFGYEGTVLLLADLTVPDTAEPGTSVTLKAEAQWLVCADVCLPGSATLQLSLPVRSEDPKPGPGADLFESARKELPVTDHGIELSATVSGTSATLALPRSAFDAPPESLRFFPYASEPYQQAAEQNLQSRGNEVILTVALSANADAPQTLRGILVTDDNWAGFEDRPSIEIEVPVESGSAAGATSEAAGQSLPLVIAMAFLGGLILNLMPCVFPVLGLKIMGFVDQAGAERSKVIAHGLWFTGGVLASFWILAGALIAIRAGGEELGWGFQLQSPLFVFGLALLLFVFALNLSGVFEIGTTMTSVGGDLTDKKGYSGSFFSGALATVMATPCAAPFLAPALGAALALPAAASMLVFTFVALGLALPYLLLSIFPGLVNRLPRPGPWMETFKQAMAFLLYATVAYLVWVLLGQVEERGALVLLLAIVVAAFAAWIYGRYAGLSSKPRTLWIARGATVILLLLSVQMGRSAMTRSGIGWREWSPGAVERLRDDQIVYVDFTARWCATCQVNKQVVFRSDRVVEAFNQKDVTALKADWTNHDPEITRALEAYGRSAVPFNLIFHPDREDPIILPEILTPEIVLNALKSTS